ncbi:proton-conducting transporter transmembrane domain-containing protein [Sinimarinibacterium thermocellulolyticum]|jgi:multicomponent Na+:H+ antiporter subunit D|uniref:Proton-conducting transporter membrane subunit n=1 Tax=Sinimarinibacterium thermocellulolyticum TaxID=3170016 RepID=A0ABV2A8T9_9GAMM
MTNVSWVPVAVVASSLLPGLVIFALPEHRRSLRTALNLAGAAAKLVFVLVMLWNVGRFQDYEARLALLPGLDLVLRADEWSLLFLTLSALLWVVTTVYAVGYLEDSPHRSRFFGFFSLCVSATAGIALAGNLFTLFVFYEILTLVTYPLVIHRGTPAALAAGRSYLMYTLPSGALLLLAVVGAQVLTGPQDFTGGGYLKPFADGRAGMLVLLFAALIIGFGVKAALVPLHGWLPRAMVAPAPVSALLHAVAVVKAGAFAILRVVYEVFGIEFAATLGVLTPLAAAAALTIVYGSWRALAQDELKKRLAYSTVSQVSYIVLGAAVLGPVSTTGAVVHLVHQGLMKITLFFSAGNYAETLGVHHVSEMDGIGRRMPLTTAAFTVGALGMIGVPPVAGFVSKLYLGAGAAQAGQWWVIGVLALSSLLNALYFLPILHRAWFRPARGPWPEEHGRGLDARPMLLVPVLLTALFSLGVGVFAAMPWSPLDWARLIVRREYVGG